MGWLVCYVFCVVGIMFGSIAERLVFNRPKGSLYIQPSEDGPYLFVELQIPIEELARKKKITFSVRRSQK